VDTLLEKKYRGKGAELFRELEQEFAQRRNADRPRAEPRPQQQVRTPLPFHQELTLQWSPTCDARRLTPLPSNAAFH
jgi:hypothetical protein